MVASRFVNATSGRKCDFDVLPHRKNNLLLRSIGLQLVVSLKESWLIRTTNKSRVYVYIYT